MTQFPRLLFLGLVLLGSQLSAGCYLGYTNRPILFPNVAITPTRPLLSGGCGGSLFPGRFAGGYAGPGVSGPVCDSPITMSSPISYAPSFGAPFGYDTSGYGGNFGGGTPGCTNCGSGGNGIPIGSSHGGYGVPMGSGYGGYGVPMGPGYGGTPFGGNGGYGVPIQGGPGGPPIAVSPHGPPTGYPLVPAGGGGPPPAGPVQGVPFDSSLVPTVKPPAGSIPLQMPNEVKESKKLVSMGK